MKIFNTILILISITTLTACGGGSSSGSSGENPPVSKSARILDSAVEGLGYSIDGGTEQYTDNTGQFVYSENDDKITFKIGKLTLKADFLLSAINADKIVFPTDLMGVARNNVNQSEVIKILQVLQSLDEDSNPDNDIKITPAMRESIAIVADITTTSANAVVIQANRNLITEQAAVVHFKKTLKEMFGLVFKNNSSVNVAENQTVAITLKAESDNNNAVTYTISGDDSGSFTVNANTGVVLFKTAPDFEDKQTYTFTATASNDSKSIAQTVIINITNVNDAPAITSTAPTTATEDTLYTYTPIAIDAENNTLTWLLSNEPSGMTISATTGQINWTPLNGVTTSGEITLTVTDSHLTATQKFTIAVTGINDAPTITSTAPTTATEDTLYTYTPIATDAENNILTWLLLNEPSGMIINATTGQINWTPLNGVTTSGEITLTVTDSHLTATQKFAIAVTGINDAPAITSTAPTTATEDTLYTYTPTATDAENNILAWSLSNEPSGMTISNTTGQINWTPLEGVTTSGEITLTVTDSHLTATQKFTVTVTGINDAPTITSTAPTTATEDTLYTYTPTATDAENNILAWSLSNEPSGMTISNTTGQINWTPLNGVTTSGEITLTVTDSHLTATQKFAIAVTGVNDAPVITSTAPTTVTKGATYTYAPIATDVDSDTLAWSLSNEPSGMTISSTTGEIDWMPLNDVTTSGEITLTVTDSHLTATQKFTIEITPANIPPIIESIGNIDVVESNKATGYTVRASDNNGDTITYSISGGADKDLFSLDSTSGVLTFKVAPDFEKAHDANVDNNYTLIIQASDGIDNTTKPLAIRVIKQQPLLVIRIEFNDITLTNPASTWEQKIFGVNRGQLNHYFNEISEGRYQFTRAEETQGTENDGIITVKLDADHPNSGNNFSAIRPKLTTALDKADAYIDYSKYDKNKNGSIEKDELQLLFLVAGGESASRQVPGIWAHASAIPAVIHDGVRLSYYSVFGERHNDRALPNATIDATIGVIAHELGHAALNLPDLYDTSSNSSGIGYFGLMGAGVWGNREGEARGHTPTHMSAWSKAKAKFTYPVTLATGTHNNLSVMATTNDKYQAYKVETGRDKEYFLIENRTGYGYDLGLFHLNGNTPGSLFPGGLLIFHIDDNVGHNNDKSHRMVDVEEANNPELDEKPDKNPQPTDIRKRGHVNNLFFNGNNTLFNDTSTPNSKRYDGTPSGVSISDISAADEAMTITVIKN